MKLKLSNYLNICLSSHFDMADESFLLVSLDEDKSKKLAQVLSNNTSRKILDLLSKKEFMTETEISEELKIPLSTAHYNLDLLVKTKLINDDYYKYSKKGKKINHYSLSNKYVIIAPKKTSVLKQKLKEFLPVVLILGAGSLILNFFYRARLNTFAAPMAMKTVEEEAVRTAGDAMFQTVETATASNQEFALFFLIGGLFTLLTYFLWSAIITKKANKKK